MSARSASMGLLGVALLLAFVPPRPAVAVDPAGSLPTLLERFPADEAERRTSDWYEPLALVDALYSLFRSPTPPAGPDDASRRLAEAFQVGPTAGRALLEATLCSSALSESAEHWDVALDDQAAVDAYLRPCNERVLAALREAPDLPAVRKLVARSVEAFIWRLTDAPERLAAEVAALPEPVPVALDLADRLGAVYHARLTEVALDRLGPHPAVLFEAVAYTDDPVFRAAAYEAAWEELGTRGSRGLEPAPPEVERFVARQWLWVLLRAGLDEEARQVLAAIPSVLRRGLVGAPPATATEPGEVTLDGLPLRGPAVDLRIPLAALWATGHDPTEAERARESLSALPEGARPATAPSADTREVGGEALARQVLDRLAGPSRARDPFGFLTEIAARIEEGPDRLDPLETGAFVRATAELASEEGYPEIAAYLLGVEHRRLTWSRIRGADSPVVELPNGERTDPRSFAGIPVFPREIEARVEELGGALDRELERLDELRTSLETRTLGNPPRLGGDELSVSSRIERLLATERFDPFVEKPLPPGVEPVEIGDGGPGSGTPHSVPAGLTLPDGFRAVRAELRGREAVAVGASQDYDPVGEVTAGGYSVVRSHDAGGTWSDPLYTGLRVNLPYVVRPVSDLPLLDGETLRIEVDIREIDRDRIVFPPVAVSYERQQTGLYVEARWEDLERDSDGDGLTDLVEERLVTDPERADSDGDGVMDAADPFPQVPAAAPTSAAEARRARALIVALARIVGVQEWAILPLRGPEGEPAGSGLGDRPVLTDRRTLFLRADRGYFRSVDSSYRVVVLTSDELARYREKFGLVFASRIRLLSFDRESRRGFVIWTASWEGGTFRLEEREDGRWELVPISSWIT